MSDASPQSTRRTVVIAKRGQPVAKIRIDFLVSWVAKWPWGS